MLAVKYKQWKNTLRFVDIQYRVKPRVKIDGEYSDEYSEIVLTKDAVNYELLAGHDQLGSMQPVALIQNLTNDVQGPNGVNFQAQDLEFKVTMQIRNLALETDFWTKTVKVDSLALATRVGQEPMTKVILSEVKYQNKNYIANNEALYTNTGDVDNPVWVINDDDRGDAVNGVPPYHFVQVYFPPFEPSDQLDDNLGMMRATLSCTPRNPYTDATMKDMWPFDDTTDVEFFVMKRYTVDDQFADDVTEWHQIRPTHKKPGGAIPSVEKWVNIGTRVVSGDGVSRHPLPPRGDFNCANSEVFPNLPISSPVIRFVRPGSVGFTQWGGTELRSFPIDMTGKNGARLSFSIQRTNNPEGSDWVRNWTDQRWTGVEQRVVQEKWSSEIRKPDELRVEFALPSPDGVQGIANIDLYDVEETPGIQPAVNGADRWRYHQRRGGAKAETKMSAFSMFGGGGHMVGFIETGNPEAPDSAMAPPTGTDMNGLVPDFFDDGIDFGFRRFVIPIPDTIINAPARGAEYFRFRLKSYCQNNQTSPQDIPDDQDEIFVDNIRIVYSDDEDVDLEMTSVNINWPYTMQPASQAIRLPIEVELSNNTSVNSPHFQVEVRIAQESAFNQYINSPGRDITLLEAGQVYCRRKMVPTLRAGKTVTLEMPTWNAAKNPPGRYVLLSNVYVDSEEGGARTDMDPTNDTTFYAFEVNYTPVLGYDDPANSSSNVDSYPGAKPGRGLTTYGHTKGGVQGDWNNQWSLGAETGDGSGQFAVKFVLDQADTVKGFQAYFCGLSMAQDEIALAIYEGRDGQNTPQKKLEETEIYTIRGWDDNKKEFIFDEYVDILLKEPVVLQKGVYWITITQLGQTGLELGASETRSAMRTTNWYLYVIDPNNVEMNGSSSTHLMVDKSFRRRNNKGDLVNNNVFAFENTIGSGNWEPFMPTTDNPGYANLNFEGLASDGKSKTYSRGTWVPLFRPYFGDRKYGEEISVVPCAQIPVKYSSFNAIPVDRAIQLAWETKEETNNYGFYVERKDSDEEVAEWRSIGFVRGNNTTKVGQTYKFEDTKVKPNVKYYYRLRQVDAEGHRECASYSNTVEVMVNGEFSVELSQNEPNPCAYSTRFNYYLPTESNVRLDIIDMYGNLVKTLVDGSVTAGGQTEVWDTRDNNGNRVATGNYIVRMTVDGKVLTRKMAIVR